MIDFSGPRPHSEIPVRELTELYELCSRAPEGDFLELGVYKGGSAWVLDQVLKTRAAGKLHLFDSFEGISLKSEIDLIQLGRFADTNLAHVRDAFPDAVFHVGLFPATLTDDVKDLAFIHIDCDQYATCKAAIEMLWPRMVPGGILAFDDYPFPGIKKAIHDFFKPEQVQFTTAKIPYIVKAGT